MTTHVELELARQPEAWRAAAAALPLHEAALPARGQRVAVVGCGTSLYMARAWSALREAAGHGETDAFPASEYRFDRTLRPCRGDLPVRHHHRGAAGARASRGRRADHGGHGRRGSGDRRAQPPHDRPADGGRGVGGADRVPHHRRSPSSAPRSATTSRACAGRRRAGAHRPAPGRPDSDRAGDLRRRRLGRRDRRGGGAQVPRGRRLLDRVLPGDGVPTRPDQRERAGHRRLGLRRRAGRLRSRRTGHGRGLRGERRRPDGRPVRAQRLAVALAHRAGRDPDRPRSLTFSVVLDQPGS